MSTDDKATAPDPTLLIRQGYLDRIRSYLESALSMLDADPKRSATMLGLAHRETKALAKLVEDGGK